jgi:hypothetical protein
MSFGIRRSELGPAEPAKLRMVTWMANPTQRAAFLAYLSSWSVLAALSIIGMTNVPNALYSPIDGQWAKWNAQAILHFGKFLDLSPHNMLGGMGSMYLPNLPWFNPGALVLALPLGDPAKDIVSYVIYGVELAVSILVLARAIGTSWLTATVAAQLHLYLLFPPFSEVFGIFNWYSLGPVYAHLTATLNVVTVLLLECGRRIGWLRNIGLCLGILALFVSGLTSAPLTFIFFMPPYAVMGAVLAVVQRPSRSEWAWKIAALIMCLMFFVGGGLPDYYLGTAATSARTPASPIAWNRVLSLAAWLELFRDYPLCQDAQTNLLICTDNRGAWLQLAGLVGAAAAIITRRDHMRAAAWTLIALVGALHLYSYAYQAHWLGWVGVLSHYFVIWSTMSFVCIFAAIAFCEFLRQARPHVWATAKKLDSKLAARALLAVSVIVIAGALLNHPYGDRYRWPQLISGAVAIGALLLACNLFRRHGLAPRLVFGAPASRLSSYQVTALAAFPVLAVIHLSMGVRQAAGPVRDPSIHEYLRDNAAIELGKPFRGYASTIWMDKEHRLEAPGTAVYGDTARYVVGRYYFKRHYGDTFTEVDLWRLNIPTFEEYGQWASTQAHAFVSRLLAPARLTVFPNLLRAYAIDPDILGLLGVRYVITDAETIPGATLRRFVAASGAVPVRLFELNAVNLANYSPTRFLKAHTADAIADRINENKHDLRQVAVISEELAASEARARNVFMTIERDGFRLRAESTGLAHIVLPVQFSHCLVVVNGAPVRLTRVNLFQTLISFAGSVDAKVEFRFGLIADNKCRLMDGSDNRELGL